MFATVAALRQALDAPPRLSIPEAVKYMSDLMGLPSNGASRLPEQVEALAEATGLVLDEEHQEAISAGDTGDADDESVIMPPPPRKAQLQGQLPCCVCVCACVCVCSFTDLFPVVATDGIPTLSSPQLVTSQ